MSHAHALSIPSTEFQLVVLNGPEKGSAYRLMSTPVTIGRDSDNDIVIAGDPKCSRQHAVISFKDGQFIIESRSQKNSMSVNGSECDRALLQNGSLIGIGDTEIRFVIQARLPIPSAAGVSQHAASIGSSSPRPIRRQKANTNIYIVLAVIGLLAWWLLSDSSAKKNPVEIRDEEQIESDIADVKKLEEARLQQIRKNTPPGLAAEQAQSAYVKGFRDYRKGQFARAMESFQACLSLNPNHQLCNRYMRLSERRHGEVIQKYMVLGRKYRDQNQFAACQSAFRNVMSMVRDPNSKIYEEAKANHDACQSFVEGRF